MKKNYIYLLIITFLIASSKCKKSQTSDNPYGLPNATTSGMNTFGCLINGKTFISYTDYSHLRASVTKDSFEIGATKSHSNYFEGISLRIHSDPIVGKSYAIDSINASGYLLTDSTCEGIQFTIFQSQAMNGLIKLTKKDTLSKIVSGIFNCIIPFPNCDTLKLTDGRFDLQYY